MIEIWKEFLLYNKGERRSIITLCLLLILSTIFFVLIPYLFPPKVSAFSIKSLNSKINKEEQIHEKIQMIEEKTIQQKQDIRVSSFFDPNTVSAEELASFGLAPKLIKTWINYTSKGGKFREKEDLQKLYGMKTEVYNALEASINIASKPIQNKYAEKSQNFSYEKKALHINLNTADTSELKRLPMIGSGRAKKIVIYRSILGGFVQLTQLKEVYGFNDSIYDAIKALVYVESGFIPNKVLINIIDNKEMSKHPYFRPFSSIIVNYRKEHGPFKSVKDLNKVVALDEAAILRILPYINFDTD